MKNYSDSCCQAECFCRRGNLVVAMKLPRRCAPRIDRLPGYFDRQFRISVSIFLKPLLFCLLLSFGLLADGIKPYHAFDNQPVQLKHTRFWGSNGVILGIVSGFYIYTRPIYYDEPRVSFRFSRNLEGEITFFDNKDLGQDKFGHLYSSSLFSQNIYYLGRWSGMSNRAASWYGWSGSVAILTGMEIHDAFYERWGFSVGDFIANIIGAGIPIAQQNIPALRHFDYKLSFDFTGSISADGAIESYQNMTFWLSANPAGLLGGKSTAWLPDFLNIAAGVGITPAPGEFIRPKRELYIGLDLNLKNLIRPKSPFASHLVSLLDRFRLPMPAIRLAPGYIAYGIFL